MLSSFFRPALMAAALTRLALAQGGSQVPSDLSGAFDPTSITLKVDFNGNSAATIADGQTLKTQDVQNQPVFALGDGSGINTALKFVIVMVDTTSSSKRVIHYVHPDFGSDGTHTEITSSSQPVMAYKPPGTLLDIGSRQYSWLLYEQTASIKSSSLPPAGQSIDMASFQSANGLQAPLAGLQMKVSVSGVAAASPSTQQTATSSTQQVLQQSQAVPTTSTTSAVAQQPSNSASASANTMSANTMMTQSMAQQTAAQQTTQQTDTAAATTPTVFSTSTVAQTTVSVADSSSSTPSASASQSGGNSTVATSSAASIAPWALPLLMPLAILVPLSFT